MWKTAFTWAIVGLLTAGAIHALAGQIPYVNPGQLAIPATGGDLNALVNSINANVVLGNGPALSTFQTGAQGVTIVDGLQVAGAAAGGQTVALASGVGPLLQSYGPDTNVNLGLGTQGNGLVQFVSPTMWSLGPTLAACPGYAGHMSAAGVGQQTLGPSPTVTGFLYFLDYSGKPHGVPVC